MPCSYCKSHGHNIRTCNCPSISIFHELCLRKMEIVRMQYDNDISELQIRRFIIWLGHFVITECRMNLLYAYGNKFYKIKSKNLTCYLKSITNSLFGLNSDYPHNLPLTQHNSNLNFYILKEYEKLFNLNVFNNLHTLKWSYEKPININTECSICYEIKEPNEFTTLNCNHHFCTKCLITHLSIDNKIPTCALCRQTVNELSCHDKIIFTQFCNILGIQN